MLDNADADAELKCKQIEPNSKRRKRIRHRQTALRLNTERKINTSFQLSNRKFNEQHLQRATDKTRPQVNMKNMNIQI